MYRTGGEEFLLLASGASEQDACAIAETPAGGGRAVTSGGVRITISIGVVSRPADGLAADCDQLMSVADTALYAAKRAGRNRVHAAAA